MPDAPERELSSTGAITALPLLSTPGSMPTPAAKKWKAFFATMARHIRWARSHRTHSAFTTWQGAFGSGPRTVTTTATPAFPPTGARTRPLRATPRRRTAKAIASELIAAARGCFRRGFCDWPPENAILPTSADIMGFRVARTLPRSLCGHTIEKTAHHLFTCTKRQRRQLRSGNCDLAIIARAARR
jgi:hypothetical protein